jgi:O-acetyl-ADP-ribose deacetylase (regulator of RNase III)
MPLQVITGNIFKSHCETLVNPVNCKGVMGAGIALEYKLRYPKLYQAYVAKCNENAINIGSLWLYDIGEKRVLNFPTKMDWKYPSKLSYLEAGLKSFTNFHQKYQIESIAFPLLGADRGGISPKSSLEIMCYYLEELPIQVEIYRYSPDSKDDCYEAFKIELLSQGILRTGQLTGIKKHYIELLFQAIECPDIHQLNQLARVDGIGLKTLEKVFQFAMERNKPKVNTERQMDLF